MGQATEQPTKQEFNQPSNQPNIHNIKISICRINTHSKIPNHTQKRAQLIIVKTSLKNSKNSDTGNEQNTGGTNLCELRCTSERRNPIFVHENAEIFALTLLIISGIAFLYECNNKVYLFFV